MRNNDSWVIESTKSAYINGNIDIEALEKALEDRLVEGSFKHDERIDGHIPSSCRGENYSRCSY